MKLIAGSLLVYFLIMMEELPNILQILTAMTFFQLVTKGNLAAALTSIILLAYIGHKIGGYARDHDFTNKQFWTLIAILVPFSLGASLLIQYMGRKILKIAS